MKNFAAILMFFFSMPALAEWTCDYTYEAENQKVNAVVQIEKINNVKSIVIKNKTSNEVILAYALDDIVKNRLGQLVVTGSFQISELNAKYGIRLVVPKALPGPGSLQYYEKDLEKNEVEYSEIESIGCRLQPKQRDRIS